MFGPRHRRGGVRLYAAGRAECKTGYERCRPRNQEAAKDTGRATKKTTQKTGHAVKKDTKKAANKTAQKTKQGAQKVEDKTQPQ